MARGIGIEKEERRRRWSPGAARVPDPFLALRGTRRRLSPRPTLSRPSTRKMRVISPSSAADIYIVLIVVTGRTSVWPARPP